MKIANYVMNMDAEHELLRMQQTQVRSDLQAPNNTDSTLKTDYVQSSNDAKMLKMESALTRELMARIYRERASSAEVSRFEAESEALHVTLQGVIQSDTQNIAIDIDLELSRSFVSQSSMSLLQLQDPLIINLKGELPQLDSAAFAFDIDSDGLSDQISLLREGNGFLALDKNGNNRIDNGNELFGTQSGNGFDDLMAYDDDENGWIDENDAIFDKLRVWIKNGNEDRLVGLGEVGIGAIYLGATNAPFAFKNDEGETYGQMRSLSAVLFEDGRSGIISQVDLAKHHESSATDALKPVQFSAIDPKKLRFHAPKSVDDVLKSSQEQLEKRIAKLKEQYAELKSKMASSKSRIEALLAQAQMSVIQGQIMMLSSALL